MSLSSRVSALAQRVAAELHDTGWIDLTSYVLEEHRGTIRGKVKAGRAEISGFISAPNTSPFRPIAFTTRLPTAFQPNVADTRNCGGGYWYSAGSNPAAFTPILVVFNGDGSLASITPEKTAGTPTSGRFSISYFL